MKFSVLINNYDYGSYIVECVQSVLNQRYPAHEIVIVDDGSTDDSLQILEAHFGAEARVKVIAQRNQGQMAAIGKGIEAASGDIVCLLDADDRYKPEYLEVLAAHYRAHPQVDLTFCRFESFGQGSLENKESIWLEPQKDYDYGYTALLTYFGHVHWIGNLTSTLSLRIRLARSLKLDEMARDFYIANQGEYPVLLKASLLGARKYYLHRSLTEYRLHGMNQHVVSRCTKAGFYQSWFSDATRAHHIKMRAHISDEVYSRLSSEAETIPDPDPKHLEEYRKIRDPRIKRRHGVSWLRKVERKLRRLRKGFWS
jgi:glycosyltransferase involved in cell wall biosynthesis